MFTIEKCTLGAQEPMEQVSAYLDTRTKQAVACINWPEYPYRPDVQFAVAHNGHQLLLKFYVEEDCAMARVSEDNGQVWTDSCCEFFVSFDDTGYYNFEFSCIGKALLGFRKIKDEAAHASPEVMRSIGRLPSLGAEPFAEITGGCKWELTVRIPVTAFFMHDFASVDGLHARANVYKCGDNLSKPHFVSWLPIGTPTPNFHCPEFFGEVIFGVDGN